jgi:hypothetical protein
LKSMAQKLVLQSIDYADYRRIQTR